jgi:hypothetical protein
MAEEMIEAAWESDEAEEDWESDEALIEAEDGAEDIGERARRRRHRFGRRRSHYRPVKRGVRGMVMRGQKMPFPKPLATAEETNKGLASQEVARQEVERRVDQLEQKLQRQRKNDTSATGLVALVISGGLSAWGAYQASRPGKSGTSMFGKWAAEEATQMAAATSASQIAMTGARVALHGGYPRNGFGIAADVFSVAQLAAFTFGRLHTSPPTEEVDDLAALQKLAKNGGLKHPAIYVTRDNGEQYETLSEKLFRIKRT